MEYIRSILSHRRQAAPEDEEATLEAEKDTSDPEEDTPPPSPRSRPTHRCVMLDDTITLWGYPARGGVIVIENADIVDFDFLKLSRLDPPVDRAASPEAEDAFCQQMLLLGGKWFDSRPRYSFMDGVRYSCCQDVDDLEHKRKPALVMGERIWVKVGWPSKPAGALWVGEWDVDIQGVLKEDQMVPDDVVGLSLAKDMDERCNILKRLGAKFYKSLDDYDGDAHLKAWQTKWQGEVEPLEQTWPEQ